MLPKKAIQEYKEIFAKLYGVELTDKEAVRRANALVALYAAVYGGSHFGRIKNEQQEKVNKIGNS